MVKVDKEYILEGPSGKANLTDLFEGRGQLIVYHFMWNNSAARARGSVAPVEFNYKGKETLLRSPKTAFVANGDGQGISVFVRDEPTVFHTYTTYGRGTEFMMGTYQFLDLTPKPRPRYVNEWPYHDTYGNELGHYH